VTVDPGLYGPPGRSVFDSVRLGSTIVMLTVGLFTDVALPFENA
jgi:hypothetical protein